MKKIWILSLVSFLPLYGGIYQVTNTNDSGAGSLRQAIIDTNADGDPTKTITFNIAPGGVQTITPVTVLPDITVSNVTVDGQTQPGWSLGNPQIIISGATVGSAENGLVIRATDANAVTGCVIRDLVINGGFRNGILISNSPGDINGANNNAVYGCFLGTDQTGTLSVPNTNGIRISAFTNPAASCNNNIVGGTAPGQRNIVSGNKNSGVQLLKNVNNTVIQGNSIGVDKTGTVALPNWAPGFGAGGIAIFGSLTPLASEHCVGTIIGGSSPGEGNIISGNSSGNPASPVFGIILFLNCTDTVIEGNYIGVDASGRVALPNDIGIGCVDNYNGQPGTPTNGVTTGTRIGGLTPSVTNVISGNRQYGIYLQNGTINSTIQLNAIGTNSLGDSIGNGFSGIITQDLPDPASFIITPRAPGTPNPNLNNVIQGNIIAHNGYAVGAPDFYGVFLDGDSTVPDRLNPIIENQIFDNKGNGIVLQNNSNDLQQPPIINSAVLRSGNMLTISVTAPSSPASAQFLLDFFINGIDRTPITEGTTIVGVRVVPSGETVEATLELASPIPPNLFVSATATNLNNAFDQPGNTSEFTPNLAVARSPQSALSVAISQKYCA